MSVGYILITTQPSKENLVLKELKNNPQIEEVFPLFGEYDIIAKVSDSNSDEVRSKIMARIRDIEGIKDTKTLLGVSM